MFQILAVLWMALIFLFSARSAEVSTGDSHFVGKVVGEILNEDFEEWSDGEQTEYIEQVDHAVRKTAHFTEYAVLGLLLVGAGSGVCGFWEMFRLWIMGSGYAAADEFHQLFVPGRSGQISDVFLDSAGVFCGVLCGFLILRAYRAAVHARASHSRR